MIFICWLILALVYGRLVVVRVWLFDIVGLKEGPIGFSVSETGQKAPPGAVWLGWAESLGRGSCTDFWPRVTLRRVDDIVDLVDINRHGLGAKEMVFSGRSATF